MSSKQMTSRQERRNKVNERNSVDVAMAEPIQERAKTVNALVLLHALKRRWLVATVLGLFLASIVAASIWFFLPPAEPVVYAWIIFPEKVGGNLNDHPDPPLQRQTQVALIRDPIALTKVVGQAGIKDLPVIQAHLPSPEEWLARELRIEFPSGPEILQISMSGNNTEELKKIVVAIQERYLEDLRGKTKLNRNQRLDNLRSYDRKAKGDIEQARFNLKEKARAGYDVNKETVVLKQKVAMELLEQTKKELVRVQSDLRQLEIEARSLVASNSQKAPTAPLLEAAVDSELVKHPLIQPYARRIQELKESLERTISAAPTNPKVNQIKEDIATAQKEMESKKVELKPVLEAELKAKQQTSREVMLSMIRGKINDYKELEKALDASAVELNKQSTTLNQQSVSIDEDTQKITTLDAMRARLVMTIEQLEAERDPPPRAIKLSDEAGVSKVDEFTRRIKFAAIGAVATLGLTMFIVALLELRTRRLLTPDDVVANLGMPVVGTVPAPPKRFGKAISDTGSNELWQTMLTESVDSFRTQLLHTARKNSLQVVMVSSAASGEGKTSLSCHLAVSLARSGLKTLLIDADLRNPSTHELFQLQLNPGLSEMLLDTATTSEAVQRTQIPGLWLLPAGTCTPRVIELLSQAPLENVLEELREEFDFIVIDTSPILPVTDPLLIAQHADGVVFSFMREITRMGHAKIAIDRLRALNVLTLGAVVNGIKASTYGYNRRYYSYPINN